MRKYELKSSKGESIVESEGSEAESEIANREAEINSLKAEIKGLRNDFKFWMRRLLLLLILLPTPLRLIKFQKLIKLNL